VTIANTETEAIPVAHYNDPDRVLECMQRALKIASVSNPNIFVEILDRYDHYEKFLFELQFAFDLIDMNKVFIFSITLTHVHYNLNVTVALFLTDIYISSRKIIQPLKLLI
jgi:hypothetical protein